MLKFWVDNGLWGNTFSSGHILIEAMMNTKKSAPQAQNCTCKAAHDQEGSGVGVSTGCKDL